MHQALTGPTALLNIVFGVFALWLLLRILIPEYIDPVLQENLKKVEARLIDDPDNTHLLLAKAELCCRVKMPFDSFKPLERAYELGVPITEIEPTFWKCFNDISLVNRFGRIYSNYWFAASDAAPKLVAELAKYPAYADKKLWDRRYATENSDARIRKKIMDSLDTLVIETSSAETDAAGAKVTGSSAG